MSTTCVCGNPPDHWLHDEAHWIWEWNQGVWADAEARRVAEFEKREQTREQSRAARNRREGRTDGPPALI